MALPTPPGKRKTKRKVDDAGSRFDARMDEWGARLEEAILRQVGRSLDRAGPDAPPGAAAADDEAPEVQDVDPMATNFTGRSRPLSSLFADIQSEASPDLVSRARAAFGSVLTEAWITASSDQAWGRRTGPGNRV